MAVKKVRKGTRVPIQRGFQQTLKSKERENHEASVTKPNEKTLFIAQIIKVSRLLANNDKNVRHRVLKSLRKWLTVRAKSSFAFTETELMRLWKGLFYCMWMSDKPLVQEELAESLSQLVHCFKVNDLVSLYTACGLKTLGIEWYGLDQYRLDKFAMLVRRIIRQTFQQCKEREWDIDWVKEISQVLEKLLLDTKICIGFKMHIIELYLEELSKISRGIISVDAVTELVKPFATYLTTMYDERHIKHIVKHIFRYLIFQSDIGLDYLEKFQAWKHAGFPAGSIDAMEQIELSDEEKEEESDVREEEELVQDQTKTNTQTVLDPRAGRVDVELPQIPFDPKKIAALLSQYKFHPSSTSKSRRQILRLITEFTELSEGKLLPGMKEIRVPNVRKKDTDTKAAALRLLEFERSLYSDQDRSKHKRKRNNYLNADENVQSESEDEGTIENTLRKKVKIKNIKKKRKTVPKTDAAQKLMQLNPQVSNVIDSDAKKKKCKAGEKLQIDHETQVQISNCEINKDMSPLTNDNAKHKKTKSVRNGIKAANSLNMVAPVKRKKNRNHKACGSWDVSDSINFQPPLQIITSNTTSHEKQNDKVLPAVSANKSNSIFNQQTTWLMPVVKKLENEKIRTLTAENPQIKLSTHSNTKKRVKIALQRNTAQHTFEYFQKLRQSPAIPFDANKKPLVGVLKASPIPSPINPFYKKNRK